MNNEKIKELKAAALAATPGPWYVENEDAVEVPAPIVHVSAEGNYMMRINVQMHHDINTQRRPKVAGPVWRGLAAKALADADFIAAANPAAVLELISLAERATAAPAESDVQKLADEFGLWSEQREKFVAFSAQRYEAGRQEHFKLVLEWQKLYGGINDELQAMKERAERAEAALEEWRFTNKVDELGREMDQLRVALASRPAVDLSGLHSYSGHEIASNYELEMHGRFFEEEDVQALLAHSGKSSCVICGSTEPHTGTCGSDDARALCNKTAEPAPNEMVIKGGYATGPVDIGVVVRAAPGELPPLPAPLEIQWPQLHSVALGCGVEDRNIRDRMEAAEYGWEDGLHKAIACVPDEIFDADQMHAHYLKGRADALEDVIRVIDKYGIAPDTAARLRTEVRALNKKG